MANEGKPAIVVGAGPAGLCAAIELKKAGAPVILMDENGAPGGQLFKQIHKFFGSREHKAGIRGFDIGTELLAESIALGIDVRLNTEVVGIERGLKLWAVEKKGALLHGRSRGDSAGDRRHGERPELSRLDPAGRDDRRLRPDADQRPSRPAGQAGADDRLGQRRRDRQLPAHSGGRRGRRRPRSPAEAGRLRRAHG